MPQYDPRMAPQDPRTAQRAPAPFEVQNRWWEQPQERGRPADLSAEGLPTATAKPPPSLLEMMLASGLMKKSGSDGKPTQAWTDMQNLLKSAGPTGAAYGAGPWSMLGGLGGGGGGK